MTRDVVLELTQIEALHLAGLVTQFVELLDESGDQGDAARDAPDDPAVRRLVPDAYADAAAARDFRDVTEADLLARRRTDATAVLAALPDPAPLREGMDREGMAEDDALVPFELHLDGDVLPAWLRTLAAIRLVLATRLGIADVDDHDGSDPRFGIYDWLGYRLDGLVRALDDPA